ncbi:thiol-disulfide isomerase [Weissella diestrammenae]|uniref:Thiol-disulfide isomerase n=1 Tax=Weissella diestrammenae TaxID=1162633 RepID=A0A7G9T3Q6_9LACO|nr:thiol-disulfide isomerase [Weissella diestrammenae]MCM0582713.1 thiol-disulfide isomerase [Weissella diestrammenae]QNN74731.1 thiol-disulfide isomerase [Weissella diestrammenae]
MKVRLAKRDQKGTKNNRNKGNIFSSGIGYWIISGLVVIGLLAGLTWFVPYTVMHLGNNATVDLNTKGQKVMFYSSKCSDCEKVFPTVFWHNMWHLNEESEQVQTINVAIQGNKHFIQEQGIEYTPTFVQGDKKFVTTDNDAVAQFVDKGVK